MCFSSVLLDENGHASITDFNIAVHYKEDKPLKAVAGSMAYMGKGQKKKNLSRNMFKFGLILFAAPEVLGRKGYFNAVDWWSLGVVAYELLLGKVCKKKETPLPPCVLPNHDNHDHTYLVHTLHCLFYIYNNITILATIPRKDQRRADTRYYQRKLDFSFRFINVKHRVSFSVDGFNGQKRGDAFGIQTEWRGS
jgi:serine/threonine protein kinase